MRIGIVGAGAMGTVFGAALASEHDVRILTRDNKTARAIANRGGLIVDDRAPIGVSVTHEPDSFADCELAIVAVKTYATIDALAALRDVLPRDTVVLSIQNGIEAAEQIEYALGHGRAMSAGPTTEAARLIEPGVVARVSGGSTVLGWLEDRGRGLAFLEDVARSFTECGLATTAVDDIAPVRWAKLVFNAALNPITAIARVTNGELSAYPEAFARAVAIAREVVALAALEKIALPFADPEARVRAVALSTGRNRSSMLQDLERGRPTEIEAILGVVVRRAAHVGLAVPASAAAYDEVRRLTNA